MLAKYHEYLLQTEVNSCRTVGTALQGNKVDMINQIFLWSYISVAITMYEYTLLLFQLTTGTCILLPL